jgi:hypothetical protein
MDINQREELAVRVATAFAKLADYKEDIIALRGEFALLLDGETIHGCTTWTEFCETVLNRSIRAVQYLVSGRESQAKPEPESLDEHRESHEQSSPPDSKQSRVTISGLPFFAVLSSLQTEIRRGMEKEAVQHAMDLEGVQAHRTAVWNRLSVFASEDVGLANVDAVGKITEYRAAYEHARATNNPKKPETLFLVQAVTYLCRSPKSRIVDNLIHAVKGLPPAPVIDIDVTVPALKRTAIHPVVNPAGHMADGAEYFHTEKTKLENCTLPDEYANDARKADIAKEAVTPSFTIETDDFSDLPDNPVPDPEPVAVPDFVVEPETKASITAQLRSLFKGDIAIRPSNGKSGLQSCQGKYCIDGLTEKQVRQIAKVL